MSVSTSLTKLANHPVKTNISKIDKLKKIGCFHYTTADCFMNNVTFLRETGSLESEGGKLSHTCAWWMDIYQQQLACLSQRTDSMTWLISF